MVIALLVILCVDLIVVVVSRAFVLGRKRGLTRRLGVFHGAIRVINGAVDGFRPKRTRGYGRWVRDVLVWAQVPVLFGNEPFAIGGVGEHRPGAPGDVEELGSCPLTVLLKAVTATVEVPAHSDDLDLVSGPFWPAEAGHL